MSAFRGNGRQISAIMSVFFGWQIICYLCAGSTNYETAYVDRIDYNMLDYSIDIWKDNI